jgi:hypothetical protein
MNDDNKPSATQKWLFWGGWAVVTIGFALVVLYEAFASWCAAADCM